MMEREIVEAVREHDVVIVSGDTGCGKSTQVPQFLYEAGLCGPGGTDGDGGYMIGITQPRRVAAISICRRVGEEMNMREAVGYQVRYDRSHCGPSCRPKFMTDGILLKEIQNDFLCKRYSAIVLEKAHKRSVNCDILIGLLSRTLRLRREMADKPDATLPPLKLVIMSATLRLCDFTDNKRLFPTPPPVISIDAKAHPVTVHFDRVTHTDYVKSAVKKVREIHRKLPSGSVLVFATGQREVHRIANMLRNTTPPSRRPDYDQQRQPPTTDPRRWAKRRHIPSRGGRVRRVVRSRLRHQQ